MKQLFVILIIFSLSIPAFAEEPPIETTIGDGINVEVFSFIKDFLLKEPKLSKSKTEKLEKSEIDNADIEAHPPLSTTICEGEIPQLLYILCMRNNWCENITIYQTNGVAIASSGFRDDTKNSQNFALSRPEDLKLSILSEQTLSSPRIISYQDEKGNQYTEYLRAIYLDKKTDYAYVDNSPRDTHDKLIGYMSYVSNNKKDSY